MHQRLFGVLHASARIAFLALSNSPFQMLDALFHVHVGFLFLCRLGVHQRRLGMLHQDIRMALLSMRDRLFSMLHRLGRMGLGRPRNPTHDKR